MNDSQLRGLRFVRRTPCASDAPVHDRRHRAQNCLIRELLVDPPRNSPGGPDTRTPANRGHRHLLV